jgi:hypothetical protein
MMIPELQAKDRTKEEKMAILNWAGQHPWWTIAVVAIVRCRGGRCRQTILAHSPQDTRAGV